MAVKRTGGEPPKQPNKIRFVLVEADLSDHNLTELTTAITQALRPAQPLRALPNGGPRQPQLNGPEAPAAPPADDEDDVLDAEYEDTPDEIPQAAPAAPKAPRVKKFKPPTYLHDLITDGAAFKEFAKEKAPDSKNSQYLVGAYWLKEHGNSPTVTIDKIYSCYKTAEWAAGFNDWRATLDNLVYAELMRKVGKGEWAINPTGEHQVKILPAKKD